MNADNTPEWARGAISTKLTPAAPQHFVSEFDAVAASLSGTTDLVAQGRALRAEAEGFIVWARFMGEGSAAATWGTSQRDYAAGWRAGHRARAAALKADIDAKCQNPARVMEHIFSGRIRSDYGDEVTRQARTELGI